MSAKGVITDNSLLLICETCAEHYGRTPEELREAFRKCTGLDFYDPKRHAEIEKAWQKLEAASEEK